MLPPRTDIAAAPYAEWAHYNWVWLNNGDQNQSKMVDLVEGYRSRGIAVGAINIDSTWSNGTNDFTVNTDKFPDVAGLIKDMHGLGIRVIMWVTSMINDDASSYQEAL